MHQGQLGGMDQDHPLLRRLNLHLVVARGVLSCMADRVLIMLAICLCSEANLV